MPRLEKPTMVGWEITRQCNLTCPHCFSAASRRPHNELTTAECHALIDQMAPLGVRTIGWTGGEPLLRDDLEELTAYAHGRGIDSGVTTNGVLLDERRAANLKASGCSAIQVSLDGSTPDKNYRMRRASAEDFHKIIAGIRICRRLGLKVYLAMLIGQENLDDAYDMVKLAKKEGIDEIRFCGYTPAGRGKWDEVKKRLTFTHRLADLAEFIEITQVDPSITALYDPGFGPVPPTYHFHTCTAGKETFYLKSNGDVYPCTSLLYEQYRVGNARRRSLEDLWNDPAMPVMAAYPRDQIEEPCRTCDSFDRCHGACLGAAYAYTGNINAALPICLYQLARRTADE